MGDCTMAATKANYEATISALWAAISADNEPRLDHTARVNALEALSKPFFYTLLLEGWDRIVDNPLDTGGMTRWGVAQNHNLDVDVANLNLNGAVTIYWERYAKAARLHRFPLANFDMMLHVFDSVIHLGPNRAIRLLQQTYNEYVRPGRNNTFPYIVEDGILGLQTQGKINAASNHYPKQMLAAYLSRKAVFFRDISQNRKEQSVFLLGWAMRCMPMEFIYPEIIGADSGTFANPDRDTYMKASIETRKSDLQHSESVKDGKKSDNSGSDSDATQHEAADNATAQKAGRVGPRKRKS
jgi:lysozyme family protein